MNKNVMLFVAFLLGMIVCQMMDSRRNLLVEGGSCGGDIPK
jgi:hypothetical protein